MRGTALRVLVQESYKLSPVGVSSPKDRSFKS